ncbi:SUN protein [Candidatus Terasakiella magnetica]|uniref:SUN protein n=1 Tax=Candidatus Terasakiella magnetica TaxID=1867952 RepID=A0A1C3RFX7_9PROT|nr:transcription antitermination factor NusB [Candidatus Terasakiella magnetica]SCA56197.1 SUN protein [Candidatus Terasakiella magnetica]
MPRRIAYDVLCQVLGKKRPLDEAFNSHPHLEKLSPKAKAFSRALVTATIRNKGFIDHLIDGCLDKRPKGHARNILNIMRLGVAQLYFMHVPAHAAVNESLHLTNYAKLVQYKKLTNAVLRRIDREKEEYPAEVIARKNMPDWLYESWENAYGAEVAIEIAKAHLTEAALDITPKYADEAEIWAKRLNGEILDNGSVRLSTGGRIEELDGYSNGSWWVQDAAATQAVKMLGNVTGKTVLDLCAAPGGKTMQLAAAGADVIAVDKNKNRLKRLEENMERTRVTAEVVEADLMEWEPADFVDAILLDAPCTATGTLRRHPDGLWTKKSEDIRAMADIQGTLWHRASHWVKPGGKIVYCTCSLQPEEGELMLKAFLKGHKNFEQEGEVYRSLPSQGKDGFFAAVVKKVD